ncbi:uncharacterized protein at1g01500 [Phtheirospermum japonicum]|uniref:Uncharacterized protein at1g01500 n=1 Tax=Phtheirospermum japonicum TaxID=374723 RepID=A0A830DBQ9_9LAMI|nr:uncharacterized protein at1g01500 [Phtheirospermum japonicum]
MDNLPDQLKLRHLRREVGVFLEINGASVPSSDAVSINLRRELEKNQIVRFIIENTIEERILKLQGKKEQLFEGGVRLIDLDPEPACEALPQTVGLGAAQPAFNRVEGIEDKEIAMEGVNGDKIVAEEDASTTPVPERITDVLNGVLLTSLTGAPTLTIELTDVLDCRLTNVLDWCAADVLDWRTHFEY